MEPLFPPLPDDVTALTDDQVAAELESRQATVRAIKDGDEDVIGDRTAAQLIEELSDGVTQINELRNLASQREEDASDAAKAIAEKVAEALGEEQPDDEKNSDEEKDAASEDKTDDEAEEQGEEKPAVEADDAEEKTDEAEEQETASTEKVAAAASNVSARRALARPARRAARTEQRRPSRITAGADLGIVNSGSAVESREDLSQLFIERMRSQPASGRTRVATVHASFDEERFLRSRANEAENYAKIEQATDPATMEGLVASGGICNPVEIYYGQEDIGTTARPVRDALANFGADRAGIRFAPPLTLADIDAGVGVITEDEAEAGGSPAVKDCLRVDCPTFQEVVVSSIYQCLEFDNLNSRSYPEYVAQAVSLTAQAHARLAETNLLDGISAFTTHTTQATWGGTIGTATNALVRAAAAFRSRHRTDPNMRLRVLAPAWFADELVVDLVSGQYDRFSKDAAGVVAFLQQTARINISFYIDTETGTSQVFGAQSAGALATWPTNAMLYMFPEGSMLFLDGGTLDLGVVRDSVLNETNDYRLFAETFEEVAFIGAEALRIQLTSVCPTGNTGGQQVALTC